MTAKVVALRRPPVIAPVRSREAKPFAPVYRAGETNRCPGCGGQHFIVRNVTVECGFCSTAMVIAGRGE